MPDFAHAVVETGVSRTPIGELTAQALELWSEGLDAAEIGRRLERSRERIRQVLVKQGINPGVESYARKRAAKAAQCAERQAKRERENARCAECGAVLNCKPKVNGNPSWCSGKTAPAVCRRACNRWHTREYYRTGKGAAYMRCYRQTERGREVNRNAVRQYYTTHRATVLKQIRQWRREHPEQDAAKQHRYYLQHREAIRTKAKERYQAKKAAATQAQG